MGIVLLYDVQVFEPQHGKPVKVLEVRSVRGAPAAFEMVAEYYRRRRSPGKTPGCSVDLTCHRVDGESLHKYGNAVVVAEDEVKAL